MPSGYIEKVIKGEIASFADFAWQCSRAMGVAVTLRDEPVSVKTPEHFEVEAYYGKWVEEAKNKARDIQGWTAQRRQDEFLAYNANMRDMLREAMGDSRNACERCEDMLYDVNAWEPPTPDHQGLKDFMIEQLKGTIEFDGTPPKPEYYKFYDDVDAFYQDKLESAREAYASAVKRLREAEERNTKRNDWVQDLKQSLDPWMP